MLALLTDPDAFFAERVESAGLGLPALIVTLDAIVGAAGAYLVAQRMISGIPQLAQYGSIAAAGALVGALVVPYVSWLGFTAVFYVLSAFYDAEGGFTRLLAVTGWGYVPTVVSSLIGAAVSYVLLGQLAPPTTAQGMLAFTDQLHAMTLFRVSVYLGLLFSLWRGFLWVFAVKHARTVSTRQAAVVVGVPVLLLIAYSVYVNVL